MFEPVAFETTTLPGSVPMFLSFLPPCICLLKCSRPMPTLALNLLPAVMDEERRRTPGCPDAGPALPAGKIVEMMIQCLLHLVQAMVLYKEGLLPQQRHGERNNANANANAASSGSSDWRSKILGFDFDVIDQAVRSQAMATGSTLAEHPQQTSSNAPTEKADSLDGMVKSEEVDKEDGNQPKLSEVTYEPTVAGTAGAAPSAASPGEESDLSPAPEIQAATPLPVPSEKMSPRARSRSPYKWIVLDSIWICQIDSFLPYTRCKALGKRLELVTRLSTVSLKLLKLHFFGRRMKDLTFFGGRHLYQPPVVQ